MKLVRINNNVFRADDVGGNPLSVETDEHGAFHVRDVSIHIEGCEIQQIDGRWPIEVSQDENGTLHLSIINARIISMDSPASKDRLDS